MAAPIEALTYSNVSAPKTGEAPAIAASKEAGVRPPTRPRATFHGEAPVAPHKFHKNGFPLEGAKKFLVPLHEVKPDKQPIRDPNAVATRGELVTATTGLFKSFEAVFDGAYTGGRSPKSFIGLAVEVSVDHGPDHGGNVKWEVHHSPRTEGGEYVRLRRRNVAYNGYDEITEVSFAKPHEDGGQVEPSISFTSYLVHRDNLGKPGPQEKFEVIAPENNTNDSWDKATRLLQDFAEIADMPDDKVKFRTLGSRSDVLSQEKVKEKTAAQMTDLVEGVESRLQVQKADVRRQFVTDSAGVIEIAEVKIIKPESTSRADLVAEAQQKEKEMRVPEENRTAEHMSYPAAFAHVERSVANGGPNILFAANEPTDHMAKLDEAREASVKFAREASARAGNSQRVNIPRNRLRTPYW